MILRKQIQGSSLAYIRITIFAWTSLSIITRTETEHTGDCDIDTFRKNLRRVCAVYIKRSAEYFMLPLESADERQHKSSSEVLKLWGYYLREWKSSQDAMQAPDVGYLYQLPPEQAGRSRTTHEYPLLPNLQTNNVPEAGLGTVIYDAPENIYPYGYGVPHQITVVPNGQQPIPRGQDIEDSFRRWRRNAMLKNLVVKCCSRGCAPIDFMVVAHEYSICID